MKDQLKYSIRELMHEEFSQIDLADKEQLHDAIAKIADAIVEQITRPIHPPVAGRAAK